MDLNLIQKELLKLSTIALKKNEMPVSAVIVKDNKIIAKAYNKKNIKNNVLYHAEVLCVLKASKKLRRWNLNDCRLFVSLEPCDMCKKIIEESRIDHVYYILNKGEITNKYSKTIYERLYVKSEKNFETIVKKFFKNIRN